MAERVRITLSKDCFDAATRQARFMQSGELDELDINKVMEECDEFGRKILEIKGSITNDAENQTITIEPLNDNEGKKLKKLRSKSKVDVYWEEL